MEVTIESLGLTARTNRDGEFLFENLPAGDYTVQFSTPEFEDLEVMVRVSDEFVRDLKSVVIVPTGMFSTVDGAVFAESDDDAVSDMQALPGKLSSSKDLFSNIASYRFSEMRFNVRGLDAQYSDIMLNGIRFNDAMTGYGPWSLWSGLNDATRNQENVTGLEMMDYGIGGIGGMTNINARASQMRKGFRVSVSNANQLYRFRAMVSYASGQLDNGWSYAFSFGTRQGGNGYVDGIYYNAYSYFASAEKLFGDNHRLGLTIMASPTERGAQQASTDEAYALFGNNYYNPNVGYQAGKAPQLARARHARADRDADLYVGHVRAHAAERRHVAPLRQERLFGTDMERRTRPARRLLPLPAVVRLRTGHSGRDVGPDDLFRYAEGARARDGVDGYARLRRLLFEEQVHRHRA